MRPTRLATWLMLLLCSAPLLAQWKAVPPSELLAALQRGGQVIVMRHASSPREVPDGAAERVLDEAGRASARAMGDALLDVMASEGRAVGASHVARWMDRLFSGAHERQSRRLSHALAAPTDPGARRVSRPPAPVMRAAERPISGTTLRVRDSRVSMLLALALLAGLGLGLGLGVWLAG